MKYRLSFFLIYLTNFFWTRRNEVKDENGGQGLEHLANTLKSRKSPPRIGAILILAFCLLFDTAVAVAAADDNQDDETISVMTQNLFMGTDFPELVAARTPEEFFQAVTTTYQNVLGTKPAIRMAAVAREIARLKPDLIGLQEAAIVRTGITTDPTTPATHIEFDMLQILVSELIKLKVPYTVVIILKGLDAQAPGIQGFDVRFTVQDVILARTDRLKHDFKLSKIQAQNYLTQFTADTAIGPIANLAGFASVVVKYHGQKFRFVSTHLAVPFISDISVPFAQANELIDFVTSDSPNIPNILVGDFNSSANDPMHPTYVTYQSFISEGFKDNWLETNPFDPGFTCCQAPDVKNSNSLLSIRIDLILSKGFDSVDERLVGDKPADKTPVFSLWPSDHAGVFAKLRILNQRQRSED
jgi:endonuclease/exonuclease/phosphatase family metal-dependent hydrolase